jgi:lambda family phage portal protein
MNIIDRTISAISPAAGAKRLAARAALKAGTALLASAPTAPGGRISGPGGYNGGQSDRRATKGWRARTRSANADGAQRGTLVARSRDAVMNLPLATALIDRRVTFVIGTGMMAIPQLDAERLGLDPEAAALLTAQIMRDYDRYMSSKDPDAERAATGYEQQEVVLRGELESGDILAIRVMPENQPGRRHQMAWKLIEGDRVVSPFGHTEGTALPNGGPVVVHGVELDGYGAATAYHVLKRAPAPLGSRQGNDTVRIPAWGEKTGLPNAILVMRKKRAEQARGIPLLGPVLETLKQISDLTEAELFAAVMTAMLAIVYKSPGAGALPEADYGTGDIVQSDGMPETASETRSDYRLESGTVLEIDSEDEVEVSSPGRPNPAFDPFFMALVRQLGAATETPASVAMMEFNSSYTASKAELEAYYMTVRRDQGAIASKWCDPHYEAWLFEQVAKGRYPQITGFFSDPLRRELWSDVRHRGDGKISLNPLQEAKALEIYEAHGWNTGADITAVLAGSDYDTNVKTRIGEHKRWIAGGLPVPGARGGGAAPASDHVDSATAGGGNQTGDGQGGDDDNGE